MQSSTIIQVSDSNFKDEILDSTLPILVDFWAPWCGPCRFFTKVIEEVAKALEDTVIVSQMNVDDNPETAALHSIRSIPSLLLFHNGKVLGTQVGVHSKEDLLQWIQELLKN